MLKMITTPNSILVKEAEPVKSFDKKLKGIVAEMSKTLDATHDPIGVGLAAPQVGIAKRIFLAKPEENGKTLVFINPEIIETSQEDKIPHFTNSKEIESKKPRKSKGKLLEGCLSIPNIWGNVSRKNKIKVRYKDIKGEEHTELFQGFPAVIIQHELDHLNGVLFTKHVIDQKEQLYRSYKNSEGEDEFEEIEL